MKQMNTTYSSTPNRPGREERKKIIGSPRPHTRLPEWIKIRPKADPGYDRVKALLNEGGMHTVCQEASCPNITECWGGGTATFMILGKSCTRGCRFCDVINARPSPVDPTEPARLAETVARLKLKQVVITMVTRDDLPDGGAGVVAETVRQLRAQDKQVKVEVLVSDFGGQPKPMLTVLEAGVDVMGHNVETIGRLQKQVRTMATLKRSLGLLEFCSEYRPRPLIKTGFMVGLGETDQEIVELLKQIRKSNVDIVTIGQYLRPSLAHLPVEKFYTPEEFKEMARIGREIGFGHVESGPLVRTSYKAFEQSKDLLEQI